MRPVAAISTFPIEAKLVTGVRVGDEGRGLGIRPTVECCVARTLVRVWSGNLADNTGDGCAPVDTVSQERFAVDRYLVKNAMSISGCGEDKGNEGASGLHLVYCV